MNASHRSSLTRAKHFLTPDAQGATHLNAVRALHQLFLHCQDCAYESMGKVHFADGDIQVWEAMSALERGLAQTLARDVRECMDEAAHKLVSVEDPTGG